MDNHYIDKKFGKGKQEWELTCKKVGMMAQKLKTLSKPNLF